MSEIEDDTLRALREKRSIGEFCWTCTTPLLIHVLAQQPPDAVVAYVDADPGAEHLGRTDWADHFPAGFTPARNVIIA